MEPPVELTRHSFREYVRLEEYSNVKHEYVAGLIVAMAGGTPDHAALASSMSVHLGRQIEGGRCRGFSSDLRVRVEATGLATYPDATIVCGPRKADPEDRDTITNPTLLVEVTSPSSVQYDRGRKREQYLLIDSLRDYLVVSHEERRIEHWTRSAEGAWSMHTASAGDRLEIPSIGATVDVDAIYAAAEEPRS